MFLTLECSSAGYTGCVLGDGSDTTLVGTGMMMNIKQDLYVNDESRGTPPPHLECAYDLHVWIPKYTTLTICVDCCPT